MGAGGGTTRPPATLTLPQTSLQPWARGVVWDSRDPQDVRPVVPSTREDEVGGRATLDRAALRRAAEELGWPDEDLLGQVGEGGVESRTECSWDTVLAFHHPGLVERVDEAAKIITADVARFLSGLASLRNLAPGPVIPPERSSPPSGLGRVSRRSGRTNVGG